MSAERTITAAVLSAMLAVTSAMAADYGQDFKKYATGNKPVPDFSQHYGPNWSNYCAPAAAANCVYYFGMSGHANLLGGNPIGPDVPAGPPPGPADTGANNIIAGVNAPPAMAASLASLMGTTINNGTTAANMQTGLDNYLEANDPFAGANSWTTSLVLNTDVGVTGQSLWDYMKDELHKCENVLPLITWPNGPPDGNSEREYDQPSDPIPGSIGHVVTMVGFDDQVVGTEFMYVNDPANNLGAFQQPWRARHNWGGEYTKYGVTIQASTVDIVIGGKTGSIYGVISASPVPEPATLSLTALATAAMMCRRRRG
jgi:hypothetical protein